MSGVLKKIYELENKEQKGVELYEKYIIGIIHIVILLNVIMGLAIMTDKYLMPCLEKIGLKYQLSELSKGIILALGISIPEMTTNFLSITNVDKQMIEYGFGTIVGSGVFDFTICLGITAVYSQKYHKKAIKFDINSIKNNFIAYLISLMMLVLICWDFEVTLFESTFLVLSYPLYIQYFRMTSTQTQDSQLYFEDEEEQLNNYNIFENNNEINSENNNQNKIDSQQKFKVYSYEQQSILEQILHKTNNQWTLILNKILICESPILVFMIICLIVYLITKFSIYSVSVVVNNMKVNYSVVGLTISSWGGNIADVLNGVSAAKIKKSELAINSIIGSQIINLNLCLGLPWMFYNLSQGVLRFPRSTIFLSILTIFIVVLVSFSILYYGRFKLNYNIGYQLIILYSLYFFYEITFN